MLADSAKVVFQGSFLGLAAPGKRAPRRACPKKGPDKRRVSDQEDPLKRSTQKEKKKEDRRTHETFVTVRDLYFC